MLESSNSAFCTPVKLVYYHSILGFAPQAINISPLQGFPSIIYYRYQNISLRHRALAFLSVDYRPWTFFSLSFSVVDGPSSVVFLLSVFCPLNLFFLPFLAVDYGLSTVDFSSTASPFHSQALELTVYYSGCATKTKKCTHAWHATISYVHFLFAWKRL